MTFPSYSGRLDRRSTSCTYHVASVSTTEETIPSTCNEIVQFSRKWCVEEYAYEAEGSEKSADFSYSRCPAHQRTVLVDVVHSALKLLITHSVHGFVLQRQFLKWREFDQAPMIDQIEEANGTNAEVTDTVVYQARPIIQDQQSTLRFAS